MGQIRLTGAPIQQTPEERFSRLKLRQDALDGSSLGGRYALPMEFDQSKFASAFYAEGNQALAMQREQPVQGTGYTADGWSVWKYPDFSLQPELNDKGEPKRDGKTGDIIYQKHPLAGTTHKVPPDDNRGQTLVLMFRPIEVQNQVNEIYGLVSLERMVAENKGETIAGNVQQDSGMLPEERLQRELGREQEIDALDGRSSVVHSSLGGGTRVQRPSYRVSR